MHWYWVVLLIALLVFCLWKAYSLGHREGYQSGANFVLKQWKSTLPGFKEGKNNND